MDRSCIAQGMQPKLCVTMASQSLHSLRPHQPDLTTGFKGWARAWDSEYEGDKSFECCAVLAWARHNAACLLVFPAKMLHISMPSLQGVVYTSSMHPPSKSPTHFLLHAPGRRQATHALRAASVWRPSTHGCQCRHEQQRGCSYCNRRGCATVGRGHAPDPTR